MRWNKITQFLKIHKTVSSHCAPVPPSGVAQILLRTCMDSAQALPICSDVILVLGHQGCCVTPPRSHHVWPELRWLDFLINYCCLTYFNYSPKPCKHELFVKPSEMHTWCAASWPWHGGKTVKTWFLFHAFILCLSSECVTAGTALMGSLFLDSSFTRTGGFS